MSENHFYTPLLRALHTSSRGVHTLSAEVVASAASTDGERPQRWIEHLLRDLNALRGFASEGSGQMVAAHDAFADTSATSAFQGQDLSAHGFHVALVVASLLCFLVEWHQAFEALTRYGVSERRFNGDGVSFESHSYPPQWKVLRLCSRVVGDQGWRRA